MIDHEKKWSMLWCCGPEHLVACHGGKSLFRVDTVLSDVTVATAKMTSECGLAVRFGVSLSLREEHAIDRSVLQWLCMPMGYRTADKAMYDCNHCCAAVTRRPLLIRNGIGCPIIINPQPGWRFSFQSLTFRHASHSSAEKVSGSLSG